MATKMNDAQETTEFVETEAQTEGENALQNETIEEQIARMMKISYHLTSEEMGAMLEMLDRPPQGNKNMRKLFRTKTVLD